MPDYRFTPVQAITVPRTEERQTALDLPEGLPEPKPEEPGLIRKNFDLHLTSLEKGSSKSLELRLVFLVS